MTEYTKTSVLQEQANSNSEKLSHSRKGLLCDRQAERGKEGGGPAGATPSPASALYLKRTIINQENRFSAKQQKEKLILRRHSCNNRVCPICGRQLGLQTKDALTAKAHLFAYPKMFTFTVDQNGTTTSKGFASPLEAWAFVTKGGYISRVMKAIGIAHWVWVLEFQKNGWPHWHVLADAAGLNWSEVLKKLWKLWRDKWQIGGVNLDNQRLKSSVQAVNYITKYLIKPGNFPEWFKLMHKVRLIQASRAVGRLVMKDKYEHSEPETKETKERKTKPVCVRVAACGLQTDVIRETVDLETGEVRRGFVGTIKAPIGQVVTLANEWEREDISAYAEKATGDYGEYTQCCLECGNVEYFMENAECCFGCDNSQERAIQERTKMVLNSYENMGFMMLHEKVMFEVMKEELLEKRLCA